VPDSPLSLICVGHAALDRVFTVESWPSGSAKIVASRFEECGGGMAANAAVAIARLGGAAVLWGPLGSDPVADTIRAQLRADGVDVDCLHSFPGLTSSTSAVLVDARGERLVVGFRGSALTAPADWLPLDAIARSHAVLADVRWPQGAAAALTAARRAGIPAILDAEVADASVLDQLVPLAEHAVFSARGLAAYEPGGAEAGLRRAVAAGVRAAVVTQGEAGAMWIDAAAPAQVHHLPAFAVAVVDTLAAGDIFHGAYAFAIAKRIALPDALRFAAAAAALKCSRSGGRTGAPTGDEVQALLARAG